MKSTLYRPPNNDVPEDLVWEDRPFPIKGLEDIYTINQIGHIRSVIHRFGRREDGMPVSWQENERGWIFCQPFGKKRPKWWVRDLILSAFADPRPSELHRAYCLDGDVFNHVLWNLGWLTKPEAVERGLAVSPSMIAKAANRKRNEHRVSVVKREDYDFIRKLHASGLPLNEIWSMHYQRQMKLNIFRSRWGLMKRRFGGT